MRITIDDNTFEKLKKFCENNNELYSALTEAEAAAKKSASSPKKIESALAATAIRQKKAINKILKAIATLEKEGKKVNATAVARVSGVAFQTAKKYFDSLEKEG